MSAGSNLLDPTNLIKDVSEKTETKKVTPEMKKEYLTTALSEAQKLWDAVKKRAKDPMFVAMPDKSKIDEFAEFHAFHKEFPIVSRYIICMGQYSSKAFTRFLKKVQSTKYPETREKGYMEDQWVRRQADYVRYLWESYQRGHYNNTEAKEIWQGAYNNLSREFNDFRNMHDGIEKKLEVAKAGNKIELVNELMKRLVSGEQTLDDDQMKELVAVLGMQLAQQRKEKLSAEIHSSVSEIEPSCEAFGTVEPEAPPPEFNHEESYPPAKPEYNGETFI